MRQLKSGGILGKCNICLHTIRNNDGWVNTTACQTMNGKMLCGSCLVEVAPAIPLAEEKYSKYLEEVNEDVNEQKRIFGCWVNPKTGKIERTKDRKVTRIIKRKPLNKPTDVGRM
tara:strand:+ start:209 stop:553 length:345 start_codon:yes stop_codon:yes gene_type:complete